MYYHIDSLPPKCGLVCPLPEETEVQQHFKDECDINKILKRAQNNGFLPPPTRTPSYMDCTTVASLEDAYALIGDAEEQFFALPSELRSLCDNDPVNFLTWFQTASHEDLRKYGLLASDTHLPLQAENRIVTTNDAHTSDLAKSGKVEGA